MSQHPNAGWTPTCPEWCVRDHPAALTVGDGAAHDSAGHRFTLLEDATADSQGIDAAAVTVRLAAFQPDAGRFNPVCVEVTNAVGDAMLLAPSDARQLAALLRYYADAADATDHRHVSPSRPLPRPRRRREVDVDSPGAEPAS